MDQKFYSHVKAFLLSHQIGEDPEKNLAKIKVIANSNPARWDGRLPTQGIRPDTSFSKVVERTHSRPVVPWWWYAEDGEPVPATVQDIYEGLTFDFALVYPKKNAWIYVCVEPSTETLALLGRQEHLKAFILMSLINKNFPRPQREHRRVRLGTLMDSKDIQRIFTFVAHREGDPACGPVPAGLPVLSRLVHPSSNTANWSIRLPRDRHAYGSFLEILPGS
jgi:hypothetical protein